MGDEQTQGTPHAGQPLAMDETAESMSADTPAFVAKPPGAPVYHGFRVLSDVVVDGFTWGAITDFETEPATEGDAFVIAPDGTRAGLVWEVSREDTFEMVCTETDDRWGVWAVSFPFPMNSRKNAVLNLAHLVSRLKPKWEAWRLSRAHER
jgi:hypothetical protein